MKKETLTVKKYTYKWEESNFTIYLIPEKDNYTSFYIQKEDYGFLSHEISIDLDELGTSAEEFIKANIDAWVMDCELDIFKLEPIED